MLCCTTVAWRWTTSLCCTFSDLPLVSPKFSDGLLSDHMVHVAQYTHSSSSLTSTCSLDGVGRRGGDRDRDGDKREVGETSSLYSSISITSSRALYSAAACCGVKYRPADEPGHSFSVFDFSPPMKHMTKAKPSQSRVVFRPSVIFCAQMNDSAEHHCARFCACAVVDVNFSRRMASLLHRLCPVVWLRVGWSARPRQKRGAARWRSWARNGAL